VKHAHRSLVLLALAALGAALFLGPRRQAAEAASSACVRVEALSLPQTVRQGVLMPGETLVTLLLRLGLPADEVPSWVERARPFLDLRSLPVGLLVEARSNFHGVLRALRLTPDWSTTVVLERKGEAIEARREARPVERELVVVKGEVRSSLFDAVLTAGEGDELALDLADVFQWDIDFHREVREGDRFEVLIERVRADGRTVAYGPILAATYDNDGHRWTAVRYAPSVGNAGYYDGQGRPLKKEFLRAPLRFTRITSRYSLSRMHPILGRRMPHWGVDYGAPVGTPVMATADGVVIYRGWKGGGGNTVELRHRNGFVTGYLHLSRFASGLRVGRRVSQGETVGYVGATGLATGPHLDYRVWHNGAHVNPMTLSHDPAPPLATAELPRFRTWAERLLPLLGTEGAVPADVAAAIARGPGARPSSG
jgi:murein DD-endopeptidase MepM/ murein hydrolase activator NlpD